MVTPPRSCRDNGVGEIGRHRPRSCSGRADYHSRQMAHPKEWPYSYENGPTLGVGSGLDGYPAGKHQPTNGTAPALTKLNGKNDTRANYRGDKTRFRNGNSDIPKEANTSLWITGLPADITSGELFDHLGGRGRSFWFLSTSPTRLGNTLPLQRPSHSLRLPPHSASTDPAGSAPALPSVATG